MTLLSREPPQDGRLQVAATQRATQSPEQILWCQCSCIVGILGIPPYELGWDVGGNLWLCDADFVLILPLTVDAAGLVANMTVSISASQS